MRILSKRLADRYNLNFGSGGDERPDYCQLIKELTSRGSMHLQANRESMAEAKPKVIMATVRLCMYVL